MAGRSLKITHRGTTIHVLEGQDNRCWLKVDNHRRETDKKFPAACREALTWILKEAGQLKGNYEREET